MSTDFYCGICCERGGFYSEGILKRHFRTSELHAKKLAKTTRCVICDELFENRQLLESHTCENPPGLFPCAVCDKIFSSGGNLKRHCRLSDDHQKKLREKSTCHTCDLYCHSIEFLNVHYRTIQHKEALRCKFCSRPFDSHLDPEFHTYDTCPRKIYPINSKLFPCIVCGTLHSSLDNLRRHVTYSEIHANKLKSFNKWETIKQHVLENSFGNLTEDNLIDFINLLLPLEEEICQRGENRAFLWFVVENIGVYLYNDKIYISKQKLQDTEIVHMPAGKPFGS